jgi:hypothetical protein
MEFDRLFLLFCKIKSSDQGKTYPFTYFFPYLVLTLVNLSLKLIEPLKVMKISDLEHVLVTKSDKQMFLEMEQEVLDAF